jgi:hypothetical protein
MGCVAGIADGQGPFVGSAGGVGELEVGDEGTVAKGGLLGGGAELALFVGAVAVADGEPVGEVAGGGAADDEAVVAIEFGLGQGDGGAGLGAAAGAVEIVQLDAGAVGRVDVAGGVLEPDVQRPGALAWDLQAGQRGDVVGARGRFRGAGAPERRAEVVVRAGDRGELVGWVGPGDVEAVGRVGGVARRPRPVRRAERGRCGRW